MEISIKQLISAYLNANIKQISRLSGGHINQSYLIEGKDLYVMQSLNKDLYENNLDHLLNNYKSYCISCDKYRRVSVQWEYPVWLIDKNGEYFHMDGDGNIWRMYRYLPSDDHKSEKWDYYEIGKGLGRLHSILENSKNIKNMETTAYLHDLSYHYRIYIEQNDSKKERISELDKEIGNCYGYFSKIVVPGGNIIHGDAKVANMILREGKVCGFIDLDTIMKGSVYDDIADCARSCCIDDAGKTDTDALEKLIKGYEEGIGRMFSSDKISLISDNIRKNRFMLGLRYYTDYLSGKGYFSEEYPGQTLKKACKLLLH